MRVRPLRQIDRRPPLSERRPHGPGSPDEAEEDVVADGPADDALSAARRHRASVAPEDTAHYGCSCGFQFQASVTTSVTCPHCGSAQAW